MVTSDYISELERLLRETQAALRLAVPCSNTDTEPHVAAAQELLKQARVTLNTIDERLAPPNLSKTEVNDTLSVAVDSLPRCIQAMSPVEVVENHGYASILVGLLAPRLSEALSTQHRDYSDLVDAANDLADAASLGLDTLKPFADDLEVSVERTHIENTIRRNEPVIATFEAKTRGRLDQHGNLRTPNPLLSHPMVKR
mgnify:CR=1 FL=1